MYAPVPPPQLPEANNGINQPQQHPAHHQPSSASTTTCRVHALHETDHEGRVLVELVTREPNGARFVQQHRVPPNELEAFVRYHRQRCPSFTIERVSRNDHAQAAHQQQPPTGFSTSSIGELSGYDKYGGSYGACTWSSSTSSQQQQQPPGGGEGGGNGGAGGAGC